MEMTTSPNAEELVEPVGVADSHERSEDVRQVIGIVLMLRTGTGELVAMPWSLVSEMLDVPSDRRGENVKKTAPTPALFPPIPTMTSLAPSPVTSKTRNPA